MDPIFVDIDWLRAHENDPALRVVDTRSTPHGAPGVTLPSGAERYAAGHIPGAVHLDYADALADPATPYATKIAPAEHFASVLGKHGIGDDALALAYDGGDVPYAARFVWILQYYGFTRAHILAGGIGAWTAASGALTTEVPAYYPPCSPRTYIPTYVPRARKYSPSPRAAATRNSWKRSLSMVKAFFKSAFSSVDWPSVRPSRAMRASSEYAWSLPAKERSPYLRL